MISPVAMTALLLLAAGAPVPPDRVVIGEVLGAPVYRDQLTAAEDAEMQQQLLRLFVVPVMERYKKDHVKEIGPTEEEIEFAAAHFRHENEARAAAEAERTRTAIAEIDEQLEDTTLSVEQRRRLELRREAYQRTSEPPDRFFAEFMLKHRKFERHLYTRFGGGHILWQQFGIEAFDAMRTWIEKQEEDGAFKLHDEGLRKHLYAYWTRDHGAFLSADREKIEEFLWPAWIKRPATQPTSQPASAPTTKPTSRP